jgi:DNA-binding transcriptional LysR family regulator
MRPRLDQLEALLWISKLGSFRGAARKLRVSQPAISSRIRELEMELGFSLLDRSGQRPQMTAKGLEVLRHAEQMIGLAETFRARFHARPRLPRSIRMGSADSFALTYLSSLLERLAQLYPDTHVDLEVGFSAALDRKLQSGELDIAFITEPTVSPQVCIEPVLDVEVAWLASPKLRLRKHNVAPADLRRHLILTNPHPSYLYGTMQDWFRAGGIVPQRLHTCTSLTIAAKLTADGVGIAILPLIVARRELARGQLIALTATPALPAHVISVVYRTGPEQKNFARVALLAHEVLKKDRKLPNLAVYS